MSHWVRLAFRDPSRLPYPLRGTQIEGIYTLVTHTESRTILGSTCPSVVEPRSRNIRVSKPLLNHGDVSIAEQGVRRGCCAQGMRRKPLDLEG